MSENQVTPQDNTGGAGTVDASPAVDLSIAEIAKLSSITNPENLKREGAYFESGVPPQKANDPNVAEKPVEQPLAEAKDEAEGLFQADAGDVLGLDEEKAEEVKEQYQDFKVPENFHVDETMMNSFKKVAASKGLTQDQAQEFLDLHIQNQDAQVAFIQKRNEDWRKEIYQDPEYGQSNFETSRKLAGRALADMDPKGELRTLLRESGMSNSPVVFRALARYGNRLLKEPTFVTGKPQPVNNQEPDLAKQIWPNPLGK